MWSKSTLLLVTWTKEPVCEHTHMRVCLCLSDEWDMSDLGQPDLRNLWHSHLRCMYPNSRCASSACVSMACVCRGLAGTWIKLSTKPTRDSIKYSLCIQRNNDNIALRLPPWQDWLTLGICNISPKNREHESLTDASTSSSFVEGKNGNTLEKQGSVPPGKAEETHSKHITTLSVRRASSQRLH